MKEKKDLKNICEKYKRMSSWEKLLETPRDEGYKFFLVYTSGLNEFKFYELDKQFYKIEKDGQFNHRIGHIPNFVPSIFHKPWLYFQYIPKYF